MTDDVVDSIMALAQRVRDLEANRHRLAELFPRVDGAYSNIANLADRLTQVESHIDVIVRAHVEIHEHQPAPAGHIVLNRQQLVEKLGRAELERDGLIAQNKRLTRDRDILQETNAQLREQLADLQQAVTEMKPAGFVPWVNYPGKMLSEGDTLTFTAPHTGWYQFRSGTFEAADRDNRTPKGDPA